MCETKVSNNRCTNVWPPASQRVSRANVCKVSQHLGFRCSTQITVFLTVFDVEQFISLFAQKQPQNLELFKHVECVYRASDLAANDNVLSPSSATSSHNGVMLLDLTSDSVVPSKASPVVIDLDDSDDDTHTVSASSTTNKFLPRSRASKSTSSVPSLSVHKSIPANKRIIHILDDTVPKTQKGKPLRGFPVCSTKTRARVLPSSKSSTAQTSCKPSPSVSKSSYQLPTAKDMEIARQTGLSDVSSSWLANYEVDHWKTWTHESLHRQCVYFAVLSCVELP